MVAGFGVAEYRRYPLRGIVDQLPHRNGLPLAVEKPTECMQTIIQASPSYVWPDLFISESVDADNPSKVNSPIMLVSAPGAMGKSVAAKAVAAEIGAPLIDLSSLSVGSDTLTGLLARVLGWTQAPKLIADLRAGKSAIVLDGLDEAQLRAGREHTVAFLENIIEIVADSSAATGQIVMFGRREAIETSYLVFADNNVTATIANIAPLTHEQSNELIDLELSNKTIRSRPYDVHKTHPIPFAELRETLFREIATALGASNSSADNYWNEVGNFLGYPPVLLVFAERLAVENPAADLAEARAGSGGTPTYVRHGDLLKRIVEGILDRESQKVRQQLAQALSLEVTDQTCRVLYTREEQSLRVLKYSSGRLDIDLLPPAALSDGDRTIYEELISTFVPDHPFLDQNGRFANVVFADYVRAFVAIDPLAGVHGATKTEVLQACPPAGPFFAGLVHSIAQEDSSSWFATLENEDLVDDLIKSYFAGALGDCYFFYSHTPSFAHLSLYTATAEEASWKGLEPGIAFQITNPSGVLELSSPLSHGSVIIQSGLVLRSISDEVELGPDFTAFADTVQIKARRLTALGGRGADNDSGVFLFSKEIDHEPTLAIHSYPSETLHVSAPNLWHMWRPYTMQKGGGEEEFSSKNFADREIIVGVRRILMSFRKTVMTNEPSAYADWLDRFGTGSNSVFSAALEGLIELEIVERAGSYYRLKLARLSGYGVNYAAVRGPDFSSALKPLTDELRKMDVVKAAIAEREGE